MSITVSMPVPLSDYLETTATVGVRDTMYFIQEYGDAHWNGDDTENRFLLDMEGEMGTTMVRNFNLGLADIRSLSHTFRPFVNYHYIPDVNQSDLPRLDSVDLLSDLNLITYGLDNFFGYISSKSTSTLEKQLGYFKINQGYDLRSEKSDDPLTPVNMRLAYLPTRELRVIYKTNVGVYGEGFMDHSVEGGYLNSRGDFLAADYRYNKLDDIDSVSVDARVNLFNNFLATYSIERSISGSTTVEENIALVYKPSCWSVELASNYTPGDQKFMLTFRLANVGNPFGLDLPEL
jgi:LPS-assembly protein